MRPSHPPRLPRLGRHMHAAALAYACGCIGTCMRLRWPSHAAALAHACGCPLLSGKAWRNPCLRGEAHAPPSGACASCLFCPFGLCGHPTLAFPFGRADGRSACPVIAHGHPPDARSLDQHLPSVLDVDALPHLLHALAAEVVDGTAGAGRARAAGHRADAGANDILEHGIGSLLHGA